MITLPAFFGLYLEGFLENDPVLRQSLEQLSREITEACSEELKENNKDSPLFVVTRYYMKMVMVMLSLIKAVRTGDWQLHLLSLKLFSKYFFAHDKINYAGMIPVYLAEISALKKTNHNTSRIHQWKLGSK